MHESRRRSGPEARVRNGAGVLALTVLVTSSTIAHATPEPPNKKIELGGRDVHEECVELAAGQRLSYSYRAPSAVQFNIHYHAGNAVAYPVRKNAREVRSSYVPHKARGYCMMWANPRAKPVALEYSFVVGAAPHPK